MRPILDPLDPFEEQLSRKFPGLVSGSLCRLVRVGLDTKLSNITGELVRQNNLQKYLDEEAEDLAALKLTPARRRRLMQRALHNFYIDMYGWDEGDFKRNYQTWRDAVRDVEEMFDMLATFLPPTLIVEGEIMDVRERLHRPDEVRAEHDPIKLISLARSGGFCDAAWTRHCARIKLYLVQLFFDYRNNGYAPADIEKATAIVRRKVTDRLFARGSHKRVRVIADLDPARDYECIGYRISDDASEGVEERDDRYVMEADRYLIRGGKRDIEVLFFLRGKEFVPLKSIVKNIRLPELATIGDRVAARFAFDDEQDLEDAIERIRNVIASRPGCVSDQDSMLQPSGHSLDDGNPNSSPGFLATKYNLRFMGTVIEPQFLSVKGLVDANCRHDEAHHGCYKLRQYIGSILRISFPTRYTDVPWPTFEKRDGRIVAVTHADIYEQMASHVRRNLNGRTH